MTIIRSIYTYSRILPAFTFLKKTGSNYSIDHCIYFNDDLRPQFDYFSKKRQFLTNDLLNVKLTVEYLNKGDIFHIEEEMVTVMLIKLKQNIQKAMVDPRRPRYYSEDIKDHFRKISDQSKETQYSNKADEDDKRKMTFCEVNIIKSTRRRSNMFEPQKVELDKTFEFVSIDEGIDFDDSFVIETNDYYESVDIYAEVKKMKDIMSEFRPLQFKMGEIYSACIGKK
jgi:hypothetical protein